MKDFQKLKTSFKSGSKRYDQARPNYPDRVFDVIISFAKLKPGARILDIGCGTGQATIPFAEHGYHVHGIDISKEQISIARKKSKRFPHTTYQVISLEKLKKEDVSYDLIISAQAFHWVDVRLGVAKVHALLKPGGAVAIFWNYSRSKDRAWLTELRNIYKKYRPDYQGIINVKFEDIASAAPWASTKEKIYRNDLPYSRKQYELFLKTLSWIHSLPKKKQDEMFADIRPLLNKQREPLIIPFKTVLYLAKK